MSMFFVTETARQPLCLIAEDQALIAMSLEAYLQEAGIEACEPVGSKADALALLQARRPDLAIIDFQLKDGPCTDLALELKQRGIPFVFYSGSPPGGDLPSDLGDVPWIEKPCDRAELLSALAAVAPLALPSRGVGAAAA